MKNLLNSSQFQTISRQLLYKCHIVKNSLLLLKSFHKNSDRGMTLIELIIVIIIISALSAVALPNLLSPQISPGQRYNLYRIGKIEGELAVNTIILMQKAYNNENNKFALSLEELNLLSLEKEAEYYDYFITIKPKIIYVSTIPKKDFYENPVINYRGALLFNEKENIYEQIICESNKEIRKPSKPFLKDGVLTCSKNMTEVLDF